MPIYFDKENSLFHIKTKNSSYVIHIVENKFLQHVYWGRKLREIRQDCLSRYTNPFYDSPEFTKNEFRLDVLPQEYPSYGCSDLRSPAYQIQLENGSTISELTFSDYKIYSGKKPLKGLPACYTENDSEAASLDITLLDAQCGLRVILSYTAYEDYDVITRSVVFENVKNEKLKILKALSVNVDFSGNDFDMLQLSGAWSDERNCIRRHVVQGGQSIESRRGASSPQQNPFIALMRKNTDEDNGEVFGFSFVYSGNFVANVEADYNGITRVQMGINPFDFSWLLMPGETFQTPEAVMVFSARGLCYMSQTYHRLYRSRLCRGTYRDAERPVLINSWEATFFDITEQKLLLIADEARKLGIELVVLDDGWFGHRNDEKSSLGDWQVNKSKFPGGLDRLAAEINKKGLKFGLWFEPEMISPDSELYRAHPDWCIHVPERECSLGRFQLILDLSRKDVCDAVISMVSNILSTVPIAYVKWDMNRNMTEIGSAKLEANRQRETAHRYILGLYSILDNITSAFPDVLFESCASGGGRFDPGMLYYMPQTWTSDNTDACDRLRIQYGTSIVYPAVTMGAHVSSSLNLISNRTVPLETRGNVAMGANFGYELDITKISQQEKATIKSQIEFYKRIRHLVQFGDFYRLLNPFEENCAAWMFVSEDKTSAIVFYFTILGTTMRFINRPDKTLRLKGLDAEKEYALSGTDERFGGDELLYAGLQIPVLHGDFQSYVWEFKSV